MTASEHTLVGDGWAFDAEGCSLGLAGCFVAYGRAKCTCGWLSDALFNRNARRAAHAQHVTEETP